MKNGFAELPLEGIDFTNSLIALYDVRSNTGFNSIVQNQSHDQKMSFLQTKKADFLRPAFKNKLSLNYSSSACSAS